MSASAIRETVTRAQVLDAFDDITLRGSFDAWHGTLMVAWSLARQLAGLDVALAAIDGLYLPLQPSRDDKDGRHLDPERVPIAWSAGRPRPGMHLDVSAAKQLLRDRWTEVAHRYGRLAQAAVDLIASGAELPRGDLDGEPAHDAGPDAPPPRWAPPDWLWDNPDWAGFRWALGRVHAAECALDEYNDMVWTEDPDIGEARYYVADHNYVADHMVDAVADLDMAAAPVNSAWSYLSPLCIRDGR